MNVLIIGSNSFIGSHLIKHFSHYENNIYSSSRSELNIEYKNVKHIKVNFQNEQELNKLNPFYFHIVIVLIWANIDSSSKNNLDKQLPNIGIYNNILKYFSVHKPEKILFIGSTMEFSSYDLINEVSFRQSYNAYGLVKLMIKDLAEYYKSIYKLNLIYIVSTSIVGKGRKDNNIIDFIFSELKNKNIPVFDNLNKNWSFLHIDDFCSMITNISIQTNTFDEYYLSSDNCVNLKTLVSEIYFKKGIKTSPSSKTSEVSYCSCCDLTRYLSDYGPYRFKSFEEIIGDFE
jgi:nucleoside-diphosphate-sugar epimerase